MVDWTDGFNETVVGVHDSRLLDHALVSNACNEDSNEQTPSLCGIFCSLLSSCTIASLPWSSVIFGA